MQKNKGFTLIELMVTIAVLAIIAMIAAPSFAQTVRKNQLISDIREFIDLLADTRSEAIFKQNEKVLAIDANVSTFYKKWESHYVMKESGNSSITFNRLGQSKITTNGECFVFKHKNDNNLKAYVYVQKGGIVVYNKTASSCPT